MKVSVSCAERLILSWYIKWVGVHVVENGLKDVVLELEIKMDKDAQVEQFMMGLATAIEGVSKAYNMPRYPVLVAVVVKPDHVELMANYKSDVTFSSKVVRQVDELIAHSILNHGEIGPSFEVKEG